MIIFILKYQPHNYRYLIKIRRLVLIKNLKKKNRQISFLSPQRSVNTQSFATTYTLSRNSITSPARKCSTISSNDLQAKEHSLKMLDKKLNKINKEFISAKLTDRLTNENPIETARGSEWETNRDLISYGTERSIAAKYLSEEFEVSEFPTLK